MIHFKLILELIYYITNSMVKVCSSEESMRKQVLSGLWLEQYQALYFDIAHRVLIIF